MSKSLIPWTSQPQTPVELNPDYVKYVSTARVWSLPPGISAEAKQNSLGGFAKTGTIDVVPSPGGVGVKGDGTTGLYSRIVSVTPQAMWLAVRFVANSTSATQKEVYALGSASASVGAFCGIAVGDGSTAAIFTQFRGTDGVDDFIGKLGPVVELGKVYTVVAVYPSAAKAAAYMYVNGVKYVTDSATSWNTTFTNTRVNEAIVALIRGVTGTYSSDTLLFTARG